MNRRHSRTSAPSARTAAAPPAKYFTPAVAPVNSARQYERLGPGTADVAREVRNRERDGEGGGRLHEGRGQQPERERLAEEQCGREQRHAATREPERGDEHGRGRTEAEEQRRERALDGVPEQEAVEHEQLHRERLVALPHPRNLFDAAFALEQLGDGRVVEERVGGRDRRARHEHVGDDIDGDQTEQRELPARPRAKTRRLNASQRPRKHDDADRGGEHEEHQVGDGGEESEPADGERHQRERDRSGTEPVEHVEPAVAAAPETEPATSAPAPSHASAVATASATCASDSAKGESTSCQA